MSEDRSLVLDASALLAYLYGEMGAQRVRDALAIGCRISSVNWSEVLAKVAEVGDSAAELVEKLKQSQLLGTSLLVEPFTEHDALLAAELRPNTKDLGLSLGDRACLALGRSRKAKVLTADRDWQKVAGGPEVLLIR